MSTPETTAELAEHRQSTPHRPRRLHEPWRVVVALLELLVAAALVFAAVWCWGNGVLRIEYDTASPEPVFSTRYVGSWIASAIGLCVLAGFFVLDALRQAALGIRTRRRRKDVDPPLADTL